MSDAPIDHAEIAQQLDKRFRALATGLDIARELEQSTVVRIIVSTLTDDAREATDELIITDPDQRGTIAQLQARVRVARLIRLALQTRIESGKGAQTSLIDDEKRMEHEPV